jgi:REP element-mobilizing transposase RayT
MPRKALVSVDTTPSYHVVSRCVRRTFLFGVVDNKDFSHRRDAIVERLSELTQLFCIDIAAYAIMSNHYHLVVRIQKQRALDLSVTDVIKRWSALYSLPFLAKRYANDEVLTDAELLEAERQIEERRARLYDLSWFMRCLNEPIARIANLEDGCTGRFWEGRFKSQALLDERAELQAMAYVDLNPIRAKMADKLENSDFTSIQTRLEKSQSPMKLLLPFAGDAHQSNNPEHIPYNLIEYIQLVEWTGRQIKAGKRGHISSDIPPIFERLKINTAAWLHNCEGLEKTYYRVIGSAARLQEFCEKLKQQRVLGITAARQAFG